MGLYRQVEMMEPFGVGNLTPVFCIRDVMLTGISIFGNHNEHLKFKISQNKSRNVHAVFWNKSELAKIIRSEHFLDIAFNLDITGKNGNKIVQLNIVYVKSA
jgi:single-stranded-DNA-specific exonuclease